MQFFEDHCNIETFRHAPHKWFGACLVSPIHAAELHYKKKYHLQYGHAKKLFVFDMLLVFTTFAILGFTLFWYMYDPSLTSEVYLDIETSPARVKSGEVVQVTTSYKNNSSVRLINPKLKMKLPNGFILRDTTSTNAHYDETARVYTLPNLAPGDEGNILIWTQIIALPEKEENLVAELSYTPEKTGKMEVKVTHYALTARGSVLEGSIEAPDRVADTATFPITISLYNSGSESLENVVIPMVPGEGMVMRPVSSTVGILKESGWVFEKIAPQQKVELQGTIDLSIGKDKKEINLQFTPSILINDKPVAQNSFERKVHIIHPSFTVTSNWNKDGARPGDTTELHIRIVNNGDTNLVNLSVSVTAVKGIIDASKLVSLNGGVIKNGVLTLDQRHDPQLTAIPLGQSRDISLKIPITANPSGGTDVQASLPISGQAFSEFETQKNLRKETVTPKLKIGTQLFMSGETRYYTNEGDQLGRGPLPPQIGKETKFWIFVTIENTTSKVDALAFSARIPAHISWTGKSSVSRGQDVSFNAGSRTVSWKTQSLEAHSSAGVYMEVAYTPAAADIGRVPIVLENIQISGLDSFVGESIERGFGVLKADFRNDKKALEQGILTE